MPSLATILLTAMFIVGIQPDMWPWKVLVTGPEANSAVLSLVTGPDNCICSWLVVCTHLHQGWGKYKH